MKKLLPVLLALALTFFPSAARPQSSNEMITYAQMQAFINGAGFIQNNPACNFAGQTVTTYGTFTTCIENNGACGGSSTELMPFGAMLSCRVLTSTITQLNCQWTVAPGNCNWTGSGSDVLEAASLVNGFGAPPGAPGGANVLQVGWSTQPISPNPLLVGTHITASAWIVDDQFSGYNGIPGCLYIATGVDTGVVAGGCFNPTSAWTNETITYTVPSTGLYYILISSQTGATGRSAVTGVAVSN